uniref:hypothetical protein n=1 Tax=Faecalibacterium prausnitzii TaxID=853 RepID=UPI003FEEC757
KVNYSFLSQCPENRVHIKTGAVCYALFVLSQALTQSLAGVLDSSLSGCQNYRAFGFTIIRHLKIFS